MKNSAISLMPWVVVVSSTLPCLSPGCSPTCAEGQVCDPSGHVVPGDGGTPALAPTGCLPPYCR